MPGEANSSRSGTSCARPAVRGQMKEQLVAASGDVFRKIVADAKDFAILLLDEGGHVEMWNSGAEQIFGYRAEETLGRHFSFLFVEADRATDAPRKELELARRDGRAD